MAFNKHSLKVSIIKRLTIVILSCFIILGTVLSFVERELVKEKLVTDLNVIANILANRTSAALIFNDKATATTNLKAAQYHQSIEQICLYNHAGQFFSSFSSDDKAYQCNPSSDLTGLSSQQFTRKQLIVNVPVIEQGDVLGMLKIHSNLSYLQTAQANIFSILFVVLVISLLAIYVLVNHLLKGILSPLQQLHSTALSVTENVFSLTRATKVKDDEVGELVDVFNNMLDSLSNEHEQLQFSEQRFRTLAENAPIGIFLRDHNDTYLFVNQRWQQMTECCLPLNNQDYCQQIEANDLTRVVNTVETAKKSKQPLVIEYQYCLSDGQVKTFLEQLAPIHLQENQFAGYIGSLLDITELKQAKAELEKLAFKDPLTGLANRRFFNDHLRLEIANAAKLKQSMAVLMLDLDHFKRVNDSLGHESGDRLLQTVATKLSQLLSPEDLVSRMGGDEFMILIRDAHDISQLDKIVNKILSDVITPMEHDSLLDITASIGISVYPKDGQAGAELIRNADIALYKAKDFGRNQVVYFSYTLDAEIKNKIRLEQKLRQALADDKLMVYLQPQFNLQHNRFYWAEALVRWIDDDDGFISPDVFIGLAEETGLIHELGLVVLRKVCQYLIEHELLLKSLGIEGISVNLSGNQFFAKSFMPQVKAVLNEYKVKPEQLEFELTESVLMENTQQAIGVMQQLRELGCRLSIDDFGTGYSSLAYLKQFPIHCIKIDRTFIRDIPHDQQDIEITSAIIAMAQKLGLETIAEGVETQAQSDFLLAQGCYCIQGYFYAKPMPINQLKSVKL